MAERDIKAHTQLLLGKLGVPIYNNVVGVFQTLPRPGVKSHKVTCGLGPGTPDLIGFIPGDRSKGKAALPFCLELKSETGRLREDQRLVIESWRRMGVFVAVVRSPEEAVQAYQRALLGEFELKVVASIRNVY